MARKHAIQLQLTEEERAESLRFIKHGKAKSRAIQRVQVLLKWADGLTPEEICTQVPVSRTGVYNVYHRFVDGGLRNVIEDRPVSGQPRKLDPQGEATLIALACSSAPEGHTTWTMQLLADKLVALKVVEQISDETVRQYLKKAGLSPGNGNTGA